MRKIREVLRLKFEADLSHERIAAATGVSKGAVTKYLQRARDVGLGWPLPTAIDDAKLAVLLFPSTPPRIARHAEPDFAHLHQELKRKGVTLQLLWEEYAVAHPGHAYRYSQFCLLFRRFDGPTYTYEDDRFNYPEQRFVTLGLLEELIVSIVHTETTRLIRIISSRKATKHEQTIFFRNL
jgi:hypothetical protein